MAANDVMREVARELRERDVFTTDDNEFNCRMADKIDAELSRPDGGEVAVAYVPIHPRNGPLWANTVPTLESERPSHYPTMPLYTRPAPPAVVEGWTVCRSGFVPGYIVVEGHGTSTLIDPRNNIFAYFDALLSTPPAAAKGDL